VKIEALKEFRIIVRRSIEVIESQIPAFGSQDENKRETGPSRQMDFVEITARFLF